MIKMLIGTRCVYITVAMMIVGLLSGCSQLSEKKKSMSELSSQQDVSFSSQQQVLGVESLSYEDFEAKRRELLQKYNVPDNIAEYSDGDYVQRWEAQVGDTFSGSLSVYRDESDIYPSFELLSKVAEDLYAIYPKFSEENYVAGLVSASPNISLSDVEKLLKENQEKIRKEQAYIAQELLLSDHAIEVMSNGATYPQKTYREEFEFLASRPWIWRPIKNAKNETLQKVEYLKSQAELPFNQLKGLSTSGSALDAFRHIYMSILIAKNVEVEYDKSGCLWVSNKLMTAHEEGGRRTGDNPYYDTKMDLHNNEIGRELYDDNSWNKQYCESFLVFRVCWDRGSSISGDDFFQKAYFKATQAKYFSKEYPHALDFESFKYSAVQYADSQTNVSVRNQIIDDRREYFAQRILLQDVSLKENASVVLVSTSQLSGGVDIRPNTDTMRGSQLDVKFENQ